MGMPRFINVTLQSSILRGLEILYIIPNEIACHFSVVSFPLDTCWEGAQLHKDLFKFWALHVHGINFLWEAPARPQLIAVKWQWSSSSRWAWSNGSNHRGSYPHDRKSTPIEDGYAVCKNRLPTTSAEKFPWRRTYSRTQESTSNRYIGRMNLALWWVRIPGSLHAAVYALFPSLSRAGMGLFGVPVFRKNTRKPEAILGRGSLSRPMTSASGTVPFFVFLYYNGGLVRLCLSVSWRYIDSLVWLQPVLMKYLYS